MSGVMRGVRLAGRMQSSLLPDTVAVAGRQQRRCMADEARVNAWEAPTQVGKWKEEHIVFAVLGGWAIGIYSAMKVFGGKDGEANKEATLKA